MLIIQQISTHPYFNIATEEYLLKNFAEDIFIIYRNEPSIIVGKHQNTIAEINLQYVNEKSLPVIRRLSGGGTVYHDLGNINYTFITNGSEGNMVDFKKHTQPIIDVLHSLGIDARIGGKNDIRVEGKKISGNAEHIFKNRVLHHGTLLFNSNLDELNESIRINPNTYEDKAVKSIRSVVANISEYIKSDISLDQFMISIVNHIKKQFQDSVDFLFTTNDINAINHLIQTKYSTWEWNFGYSPSYILNNQVIIDNNIMEIWLSVDNGIIGEIKLSGNLINDGDIEYSEKQLVGCSHDIAEVKHRLIKIDSFKRLSEKSIEKVLKGFF